MSDNEDLLAQLRALPADEQARLLARLTATSAPAAANLPPTVGTANVSGRVYGPTVGLNLGTVIYHSPPSAEQREHLVRYLDRVAHKMRRLRLGGLSPLDDKGLQLPQVYVMLATQSQEPIVVMADDLLANYYEDVARGVLKPDYDPDWALPNQAITLRSHGMGVRFSTKLPMGHEPDQGVEPAWQESIGVWRSRLATEAVQQAEHLVLLGDPGGGKSTFLRHLAWALAERGLDHIGEETALVGWAQEQRLLPIVLPLRKLSGWIAQHGDSVATVSAAVCDEMERAYDARRADEVLDKALANGAALLLFDGLDEVPIEAVPGETADRLTTLRAVRAFAELHGRARVVITCRVRAFDQTLRDCLDWPVETLVPFTLGQIRAFVAAWYAEIVERGSCDRDQAERQQASLISAIVERPKLREMAHTPLLLTMMALVLYEKGELPRDRPQLYERILEQLLGVWDQQKDGRSFAQVIGDDKVQSEVLRPVLDRLSCEAHAAATSTDGRGRIAADRLLVEITKALDEVRVADPHRAAKRCLHYFNERSGLLLPEDDGTQYAFAHLTLQEYCAGRHLLRERNATDLVMQRRADDRWREPILLGLGMIHKQYDLLADRIAAILLRLTDRCERGQPKSRERWYRDLIFAAEIGADRDWDLLRPLIDVERVQTEVREGLVALLQDKAQPLPVNERVRAGFLLGDLHDPRFPVTIEEWKQELKRAWQGDTDGYFCRVEAGTYIIGSTDDDPDADDNEKPQHTITIDQPFLIARYPLTNAQWQSWVEAGGKPSYSADDPDLNRPNQPVVSVSWSMCNDFCQWLSPQVGARIRLPHEIEWEAAARGGDARCYPWGTAWEDDRAATKEDRELRGAPWTVPVGCYPAGAAPCGALDLAGNVWEWTADVWRSYPNAKEPFTDEHYRVLRGGGYVDNSTSVRCGARLRLFPDADYHDFGFRVDVAPRLAHSF